MHKYKQDITGERFGHLVAVAKVGSQGDHAIWKFVCDCGNTISVVKSNVLRGKTHCGCLTKKKEKLFCSVCGSDNKVTIRFGKPLCHRHTLQMQRHNKTFRTIYDPNEFHFYCNECHILIYNKNGDLKDICRIDIDDYEKIKKMK